MKNCLSIYRNLWSVVFVLTLHFLSACSENVGSTGDSAGILIETNTGNRQVACVVVATDLWDLEPQDLVSLVLSIRDTAGDTVYIYENEYLKVVDSASVESGKIVLDSLPEGLYKWVTVTSATGESRSIAIDWNIGGGKTYFVDEDGVLKISNGNVAEDSTDSVRIVLPAGFEFLANVDEVFKDVPFSLSLDSAFQNLCLLDADGEVVNLSVSGSSFSEAKKHYWGKMPKVSFSANGSIDFVVVNLCQESDSMEIALGTYVNHLEGNTFGSETAREKFNLPGIWGNAAWYDSTDSWNMVENFVPFVDGKYMTASFWFLLDSTMQAGPGKSYTRILSAKKDSVGFIVQRRDTTGSINLRIDARKNGVGDYNKTFGTALNVLDGSWHNYAFTIFEDSVKIYLDGALLIASEFDSGEGFADVSNPAIGYEAPNNIVGGMDELFFFDGMQSENWMKLFYALQIAER